MTRNIGAANGNFSGGFHSKYINVEAAWMFAGYNREQRGLIGDKFLHRGGRGMTPEELDVACEEMANRKRFNMIPSDGRLRAMKRQLENELRSGEQGLPET